MLRSNPKRVLIVQPHIKRYRAQFFEQLYQKLLQHRIELCVAYSDPYGIEVVKGDNQDLPPQYGLKVKGIWACGGRVLYQPLLREAAKADLVIIPQVNKFVLNHMILALSAFGVTKVAFWGHGRNRQSDGNGLSEWVKKVTLKRADWWFAYTEGTAKYLVENGVQANKITNVWNAVDTSEFRKELASVSPEEITETQVMLDISPNAEVGLYCCGITPLKLPGFLIDSARQIRKSIANFELLVVGAGPEQEVIETAARHESWIHYFGPKFGREKAVCFRLASTFLMPGQMGLAILDAFTAGLPVITSSVPFHSPEIEYLEEGQNGIITPPEPDAYSHAVIHLLSNAPLLRQLRAGAQASSTKYSMTNMVERFYLGVLRCLDEPMRGVQIVSTIQG